MLSRPGKERSQQDVERCRTVVAGELKDSDSQNQRSDRHVPSYSIIDKLNIPGEGDTKRKLAPMLGSNKEATYFAGLDRNRSKSLLLIGSVEGF